MNLLARLACLVLPHASILMGARTVHPFPNGGVLLKWKCARCGKVWEEVVGRA
jgi:hypothetical protein